MEKLKKQFKKYFGDNVANYLYVPAENYLDLYIKNKDNKLANEYLEKFVKAYFAIKSKILYAIDDRIKVVNMPEFKEQKLIDKLILKSELNSLQSLCKKLYKFDYNFYQATQTSLSQVKSRLDCKENLRIEAI